jgi:DNA repair exonuclease SbcCD ATPase subunit
MPDSEKTTQEIKALNEALREEISGLSGAIKKLDDKNKRTRWLAYVLAFGLVAGGGYALWDRQQQLLKYQKETCRTANEQRAKEKQIWDNLYAQDAKVAAEQGYEVSQSEIDALALVYKDIEAAYPQRDCSKVSKGEVVNIPSTPAPLPFKPSTPKPQKEASSTSKPKGDQP